MSRFEWLARWLVLVLGLAAGCGGGGMTGTPSVPDPTTVPTTMPTTDPTMPTTSPPVQATPAELAADVHADVAALAALQVVDVYEVVLNAPEAYNCYGTHPCPGSESDPTVAAELARQAPRLDRLTAIAEGLAGSSEVAPVDPYSVGPDLDSLRNLRIVNLGQLLRVSPASNPTCYNTPCPEDVAAADAENGRRAGVVHAWAAEAAAENL
jgi:hypothetical protein